MGGIDHINEHVDRRRQLPLVCERRQGRPDGHAFSPKLAVEENCQRALGCALLARGEDPHPARIPQTRAVPLNAVRCRIRRFGMIPAWLNGRIRHLQRRHRMAASAAPALGIQRIGNRVWQQFAPALTQRHAIGRVGGEDGLVEVLDVFGGNKTVAAAPFRAEFPLPLPDVGVGKARERLGTRILMVIRDAGDVDPHPLHRRGELRSAGIPPPESDTIIIPFADRFRPFF
ncbi:hypothetical protein D3C72_1508640 [compost metagenome]